MGKSKELAELGNMTWNEAALSSYDRRLELDGSIQLGTSTSANRSLDFSDSPDSDEKWKIYGWGDQFQISKRTSSWGWASTPFAVDASGRVTMNQQPSFRAFTTANTDITTEADIAYNGTDYNIGNNFSTTTGKFTAPVSGVYTFTTYHWHKISTSGTVYLSFAVNNSIQSEYRNSRGSAHAEYNRVGFTQEFSLNAGDYVGVKASGSGGGQLHTSSQTRYSYFSGRLVG